MNFESIFSMARKHVELSDIYPYHINARANNKDWFELPLATVFDIYSDVLEKTVDQYEIQLHAFVLMSNHFHMMLSTPQKNLSSAMRYFMTESSRAIARSSNRINRIYGKRYHWTIIKNIQHYAHALYYVYRNPIHHGVCDDLRYYQWSTLYSCHKKLSPLCVDKRETWETFVPKTKKNLYLWLHQNHDNTYHESLQKALRRHEFTFHRDSKSCKRNTFFDNLRFKNTPGT